MGQLDFSATGPRHSDQPRLGRSTRPDLRRLLACLALAIPLLSACGSPSRPIPSHVPGTCLTHKAAPLAVAIGARSNVPDESGSLPPVVTSLLMSAATGKRPISLIRIDGQPKIFTPPTFTTDAQNAPARQQDLNDYLNAEISPILHKQIRAQVPQADVLTALDLAASATAPDGNIVVVDSGLSTTGPLNYTQPGLLMAPPSDVVKFLRQKNLLPQLSGRHVLLSGFGYTADPQPRLNQAQRNSVINQWVAIIKAGGGCVSVDQAPNTASDLPGLPSVAIVTPPPTPTFSNCGTIALEDAGSVGFFVGSSKFRDPSAAAATLHNLADKLKQGSEHIILIGSTSSEGSDQMNNSLSQSRAKAVETVLVSMGISMSRITIHGEGSHWPGRVNDQGPGGVLLPGPAEQDREVIVQLPHCN
jgi:OmpA-OmpF porin, OOP family